MFQTVVETLWKQLLDSGHLYRDVYSSWYSIQDEAFLTSTQVHYSMDSTGSQTLKPLFYYVSPLLRELPVLKTFLKVEINCKRGTKQARELGTQYRIIQVYNLFITRTLTLFRPHPPTPIRPFIISFRVRFLKDLRIG